MSELIKEVREEYGCPHGCGWSDGEDEHDLGCNLIVNASVLRLCDEHERLEAEHARVEGLLRALGIAEIARRKVVKENVWKDRSEYFRAVDDAIHVVCDEAVRLAKEKA